jgi:hypothetical protein
LHFWGIPFAILGISIMQQTLEEIYNAPALLRAILVGVLAGSGHGPPLSE